MGLEIERKFLVDKKKWQSLTKPSPEHFRQGYITTDPEKVIRIRMTSAKSFITLKGKTNNRKRLEYEYAIPMKDASELFTNFVSCEILKNRYKINFKNKLWEVDEFLDENEGLILAEIELKKQNEIFEIPEWVSEEVTSDSRYANVNLAQNPYQNWKPADEMISNLNVPASVIKDIAGMLDVGLVPFLHKETFELASIPDSSRFLEMDWEDEDSEWADEIKRVKSDTNFIKIESMESSESFRIMEGFVNSLPESRLKVQLENAIYRNRPFSNFNRIIHQAGSEREQWFQFKLERMKAWVIRQLEFKILESQEDEE